MTWVALKALLGVLEILEVNLILVLVPIVPMFWWFFFLWEGSLRSDLYPKPNFRFFQDVKDNFIQRKKWVIYTKWSMYSTPNKIIILWHKLSQKIKIKYEIWCVKLEYDESDQGMVDKSGVWWTSLEYGGQVWRLNPQFSCNFSILNQWLVSCATPHHNHPRHHLPLPSYLYSHLYSPHYAPVPDALPQCRQEHSFPLTPYPNHLTIVERYQ